MKDTPNPAAAAPATRRNVWTVRAIGLGLTVVFAVVTATSALQGEYVLTAIFAVVAIFCLYVTVRLLTHLHVTKSQ